jgi:uncharacterized protein
MPVRSLTSSVLKWPDSRTVVQALKAWVGKIVHNHPEVLRVGYFGSYARDDWGVGSDLDLILILKTANKPFEMRAAGYDTLPLPVPVDLIVYSLEEWLSLKRDRKFLQTLERETVWVYPPVS